MRHGNAPREGLAASADGWTHQDPVQWINLGKFHPWKLREGKKRQEKPDWGCYKLLRIKAAQAIHLQTNHSAPGNWERTTQAILENSAGAPGCPWLQLMWGKKTEKSTFSGQERACNCRIMPYCTEQESSVRQLLANIPALTSLGASEVREVRQAFHIPSCAAEQAFPQHWAVLWDQMDWEIIPSDAKVSAPSELPYASLVKRLCLNEVHYCHSQRCL